MYSVAPPNDILIDSLRLSDTDFAAITQYGASGNGVILLTRLIDARRAAHDFWAGKHHLLSVQNAGKMRRAASLYADIVSVLVGVLPNDVVALTQNGYPCEAWSKETRTRIADALVICKNLEQQIIVIINDVLAC